MATTFTAGAPNVDIAVGGWRTLNLTRAPFNFAAPFRLINEKCSEVNETFSDKCLGVWKFADLP